MGIIGRASNGLSLRQWLQDSRARTALGLAVLCVLASCAALIVIPWDENLSEAAQRIRVPGDIRKAIELSEAFAHGFGCSVILAAVLLASEKRRKAVLLAVVMTASSGLIANGMKAAFVRLRPYALAEANSPSMVAAAETSRGDGAESASATIDFLGSGSFWDASERSFPSGHTATAWGLAIGLSMLFPRLTALMVGLASLASFQRLFGGAHFPSDIFAGAAIAFFCCAAIIAWPGARETFEGPGP